MPRKTSKTVSISILQEHLYPLSHSKSSIDHQVVQHLVRSRKQDREMAFSAQQPHEVSPCLVEDDQQSTGRD